MKKKIVFIVKIKKNNENIKNLSAINELWKHKERIKYSNIKNLIADDENDVLFCNLKKYKNQFFENEKIEILFCFLVKNSLIKIYKFNKIKKYEIKNKNIKESNINILNKYNKIDDEDEIDEKEPELILLDEKNLNQISKISIEKNILTFEFKNIEIFEYYDKHKKKKKKEKIEFYIIEFDFFSEIETKKLFQKLNKILNENNNKKK